VEEEEVEVEDFKIVPKDLFSQILSFLPPSSSTFFHPI
jgi:hypothetical protein